MKFSDTKYGDLTGQTYKGDIDVSFKKLTTLEGAPKIINGNFNCSNNKLTTLEGAPETVDGAFYCYDNNLTSLKGSPEVVEGAFWCHGNKLTSLNGSPRTVTGGFYCYGNNLTTLEGAPESVGGIFNCSYIKKLTQLDIDKLVQYNIKGRIIVPVGLTAPTKEDYKVYKKLGMKKFLKLKQLKDKLK